MAFWTISREINKALDNCETVITAWTSGKLIGFINVIDDGELNAYVHYLCINPEYQGIGIGRELLKQIKEKYREYYIKGKSKLFLDGSTENKCRKD